MPHSNEVILQILLFGASLIGMLISLYMLLVYHRIIPTDARFMPRVCRMDKQSCQTLLSTQDARILGIPNIYLGVAYYMLLMVVALEWSRWTEFAGPLIFLSMVTVVAGIYLSYSLIWKVKILCSPCFVAHGLNITIFVILLELT